jgi:hypothetical protein
LPGGTGENHKKISIRIADRHAKTWNQYFPNMKQVC